DERRDRGLDTTRAVFVAIDGGKALRTAVLRQGVAEGGVESRTFDLQPGKLMLLNRELPW
ncbi:MAG TPA: hypothetical protein VIY28_11085, partial [Pseudonocardiaceae bacterium]